MNAENVYRKCLNHFEQKKKRKAAGNLLHKKEKTSQTQLKKVYLKLCQLELRICLAI